MKRFSLIFLIFALLLAGCQNGADTASVEQHVETIYFPEQFEYKTYYWYKETDDFAFRLDWIEGKIERGNDIRAKVWLINVMEEKHTWTGSSSEFQPWVELICTDTEYVISQHYPRLNEDRGYHEILPDEKSSSGHTFTIPADAPAGKYSMVCSFHGSEVIFEDIFTLD